MQVQQLLQKYQGMLPSIIILADHLFPLLLIFPIFYKFSSFKISDIKEFYKAALVTYKKQEWVKVKGEQLILSATQ